MSQDLDDLFDSFEVPAKRFGSVKADLAVKGLCTRLTAFDRFCLLREDKPDLLVIGARPGNGKTSFLVQLLREVAKSDGHTLMFSLEMASSQLKMRAMAAETGTPSDRLHMLSEAKYAAAEARLDTENFYVDDTGGIDINTLRARAMDFKKRHPLKAIGVDYIQIVKAEGQDKRAKVGAVAEGLKQLAKDLNCPVIALAQMSREIEKRQQLSKSARPSMSDLQECALLENWSDQILFLDGAGKRDPMRQGQIDCYIAKNRHGATGDFVLSFDGATTRFTDYEESGI